MGSVHRNQVVRLGDRYLLFTEFSYPFTQASRGSPSLCDKHVTNQTISSALLLFFLVLGRTVFERWRKGKRSYIRVTSHLFLWNAVCPSREGIRHQVASHTEASQEAELMTVLKVKRGTLLWSSLFALGRLYIERYHPHPGWVFLS